MRGFGPIGGAVLVGAAMFWGAPIGAQTADAPAQEAAAPSPAQIAKMFKTAADADARAAAFAALAPFAEAGDVAAQRLMARELMRDQRSAEALAALKPLIAANDEDGLDLAARLVGNSKFGINDPAVALDVYERLTELGDLAALGKVAKAQIAGQIGRIPAEQIRSELEVAAAGGLSNLAGYLAAFQSKGIGGPVDKAGSIASLRVAAEAGEKGSDIGLADALLGSEVAEDVAESLELLTSLAAANTNDSLRAKIKLITGHATGAFGESSDPGQAIAMTPEVLTGEGAARAVKPLLNTAGRQGVASDWKSLLLETLNNQINAGDLTHLDALFDYYASKRDETDLAAAQDLYDTYPDKITSDSLVRFLIMQQVRAGTAMANAADLVQLIEQTTTPAAREKAYVASIWDKNFQVYFLQSLAKTKGYFEGNPSGQLTGATLRAISPLCKDAGVSEICADGPLRRKNALAIMRAMAALPVDGN